MAMTSAPTNTTAPPVMPSTTTPKVPPEILVMIFKQLEGHKTSLQLLEVSKQFHDLVVPVVFRGVTLTEPLVKTFAQQMIGSVPTLFQRLVELLHAARGYQARARLAIGIAAAGIPESIALIDVSTSLQACSSVTVKHRLFDT